jgi:hypothetical protein
MEKRILHGDAAVMKLQELRDKNLIILECIVGSQAYGTALPESDVDKKFIYIEPLESVLRDEHSIQLNVTKDYVGYEIGRFAELVASGNPNMLDLLAMPEDCIISMSPLFKKYFADNWQKYLTKEVENAFGRYASSQIEKSRGENKKVRNPQPKERLKLIDFCWTAIDGKTIPIKDYLRSHRIHHESVGLAELDHMKYYYALYVDEAINDFFDTARKMAYDKMPWPHQLIYSPKTIVGWPKQYLDLYFIYSYGLQATNKHLIKYKGIEDKDGVQAVTSNIPKGQKPLCYVFINKEAFQKHCKDWKDYWNWMENRNELRWKMNLESGAEYDTKNMAHCIRLLQMCLEILRDNKLIIRRPNREELLNIRSGKVPYEDLLKQAGDLMVEINEMAKTTSLPDKVDEKLIADSLFHIRQEAYNLSFTSPQV